MENSTIWIIMISVALIILISIYSRRNLKSSQNPKQIKNSNPSPQSKIEGSGNIVIQSVQNANIEIDSKELSGNTEIQDTVDTEIIINGDSASTTDKIT